MNTVDYERIRKFQKWLLGLSLMNTFYHHFRWNNKIKGNPPCEHWVELERIERIRKLPKWLGIFTNEHLIYYHFSWNNNKSGEDNSSVITESNVEPLAPKLMNTATWSTQIAKAYHSALSEVIDILYKYFILSCVNGFVLLYLDCTLFSLWELIQHFVWKCESLPLS